MAVATIDVEAGEGQPHRLERLRRAALMAGCDYQVFPEPWGTSRPVAFHAWTDRSVEDEELALEIMTWAQVEQHGEWLREHFPGRYEP